MDGDVYSERIILIYPGHEQNWWGPPLKPEGKWYQREISVLIYLLTALYVVLFNQTSRGRKIEKVKTILIQAAQNLLSEQ